MSDIKLLVAAGCKHVEDPTADAVESWVGAGGSLVVIGDAFAQTEYGHERTGSVLTNRNEVERSVGTGRIYKLPAETDPKESADLFERLIDAVGIRRPLRLVDHYHHRTWGVRMQVAEWDGGYLAYVVNLLSRQRLIRVIGEGAIGQTKDLISGKTFGPLVELAPLEPMLFKIS